VDLPPGWPNPEQFGLLENRIHLAQRAVPNRGGYGLVPSPLWPTASPETLADVGRILLDYLRRELTIKVDVLDRNREEQLVQRSEQRLIDPSNLGSREDLSCSTVMFPISLGPGGFRGWRYLSAWGGFGLVLRRPAPFAHQGR
jgi:hypothetical protein